MIEFSESKIKLIAEKKKINKKPETKNKKQKINHLSTSYLGLADFRFLLLIVLF